MNDDGNLSVSASAGKELICGVVEGFYGRPWTTEQRKELFRRMGKMFMNCYVYAPKDDLKHRAYWRDLYTVEEADHLQSLIEAAKKHNVIFYYALSPGLDIVYSSSKEINQLKQKLDQVKSLGCEAFALLFDDIEPTMSEADRQKFSSFAQAQVSVSNEIFEHLGEPQHFMFCPTEYCESRAVPTLETSEYLRYVGKKLVPNINVLWTGPRVISRILSPEHLRRVSNVLCRKPLIWDNLHANDYDNKRIFVGPYGGRSVTIKMNIAGVVTNPNCEFEANYVAMHTLAHWIRCTSDAEVPTAEDAALEAGGVDKVVNKAAINDDTQYHPVRALYLALNDWLPEISAAKIAFSRCLSSMPPDGIAAVGINTCASETSSSSSLTTAGAAFSSPGLLPLYTPASVAEAVKNPYAPPPFVDPSIVQDPLLTPAMQAVNSLTDEYSEPMELAASSSNSVILSTTDNSPDKTAGSLIANGHEKDESNPEKPLNAEEMMESKSFDNLPSAAEGVIFKEPNRQEHTGGGEAMLDSSEKAPIEIGTQKMEENLMQVDANKDEGVEEDLAEKDEKEMSTDLGREDIQLLAELFYLPFEHGPRAYWIIEEFMWLKANGSVVRASKETGSQNLAEEWLRRSAEFDRVCKTVTNLCRRIVDCPNRGIVYDFYPYIWDLQGVLNVLNAFVKWMETGSYTGINNELAYNGAAGAVDNQSNSSVPTNDPKSEVKNKDHPQPECEPWIFRGGLMGELQRLLPVESVQDLFVCRPPHPPCGRVFRARPYCPSDRGDIYELCNLSLDDMFGVGDRFRNFPELVGDWLVGAYLEISPDYCFVVEDEHKDVVGFVLGAKDSMLFFAVANERYMPKIREKYAPFISDDREADDSDLSPRSRPRTDSLSFWTILTPEGIIRNFFNSDLSVPHSVYSRYQSVVVLNVQPSVSDTAAPKRLLVPFLAALKANGSTGVHCQVRRSERNLRDLYARLGFFDITVLGEEPPDYDFLGRLLQ